MDLEWRIPEVWNAFERNRNRAYHIVYCQLVAYENLLLAMDLLKQGYEKVATPYKVPQDHRIGVGFWGAGRGWLTHHLEMDKGALINYQIITPSTIKAGRLRRGGGQHAHPRGVRYARGLYRHRHLPRHPLF